MNLVLCFIFVLGNLFPLMYARLNLLPHGKKYAVFHHLKSKKFLSANGIGTDEYSARENYFEIVRTPNGDIVLFSFPMLNPPGDSSTYALDVNGGCRGNSTVSPYRYSGSKNQLWRFNVLTDAITTACNHNWGLTILPNGTQTVRMIRFDDADFEWLYFYSNRTEGL